MNFSFYLKYLYYKYIFYNTLHIIYTTFLDLLRKEVDRREMSQHDGLGFDSDYEFADNESDDEYQSADENISREVCTYDIEKMFEIVNKRDFNKWKMNTIHHSYRQVHDGSAGRKQISRLIIKYEQLLIT